MLINELLLLIVVLFLVYWYITRTFNFWKEKNVIGPAPIPLFGNTIDLVFKTKYIGDIAQGFYNQFPNEKVVGFYRMTTPYLLIRDPDIIKHILVKDFDIFADRGLEQSQEGLGAHLFALNADSWRVLRTRFSPTFTSGKLKSMFHLISENSDKYINIFEKACSQQPEQDVLSITRMYTMSALAGCAFGLDMDLNYENMKDLDKLDQLILDVNAGFEIMLMYPSLFRVKLLNSMVFPTEVTKFFHDLVDKVFTQRKYKPSTRNDYMDVLLELKLQKVIQSNKKSDNSEFNVEFNDAVIAAQAFVFYVAGFGTSAITLGFLLFEMSRNHDIQDKLIAEIDNLVENCSGNITYEMLMEMPYLSMVFDETLRKYPVVDPLQRAAQADYKIPGTDVTIRKGQIVFVSAAGLHYDEKYFSDPQVFDPERFSPDKSGDRHSCIYLPFGIGPRHCIGMRFSKLLTRMFIVKLLSKFRVQQSVNTPEFIKSNPRRAILGSKDAMKLNFVPRIRNKS